MFLIPQKYKTNKIISLPLSILLLNIMYYFLHIIFLQQLDLYLDLSNN